MQVLLAVEMKLDLIIIPSDTIKTRENDVKK